MKSSYNNYTIDKPPILDVLSDHGVPIKMRGRRAMACCVFHNEKSASFVIYPDQARYHCYGCGANGDSLDLLAHLSGRPLRDVIRDYATGQSEPKFRKMASRRKAEARQKQEQINEFNRLYRRACILARELERGLQSYEDYAGYPETVHLLAELDGMIEAAAIREIPETVFVGWVRGRLSWLTL